MIWVLVLDKQSFILCGFVFLRSFYRLILVIVLENLRLISTDEIQALPVT